MRAAWGVLALLIVATAATVARGHLEVLERNPAPERAEVRETTARAIRELSEIGLVDSAANTASIWRRKSGRCSSC